MQTTKNFNRKFIQALTKEGLNKKIIDSEKRGWQLTGEVKQLSNGHWACLVVKDKK